jgi:1-acyl-sn-glycerol-3-phosphate acyltransferase
MADPKVVPIRDGDGANKRRSKSTGADMLAAGAARASGERAKRRRTPLLTDASGDEVAPRPILSAVDIRATSVHRPRPVPKPGRTPGPKTARGSVAASRHAGASTPKTSAAPAIAASGVDDLVAFAIATMRRVAAASGLSADDVERQVAATLAFVRRRLSGDYTVDDFGFDRDFTENAYLPLLRPLYKSWFRVEVRGIENIPSVGGALIVANHSGTIALDSLMTQVAVHDEHPEHRYLRMLGADLVFRTPVVGAVARKSGATLAANPDAERLLASGELAGVWPEGFKGVGKPFSERYKLQRFGRGGFVAAALRTRVPIVPCSIVGAEEIYPILGNLKTVARLIGAPYIPVTPTFPLLGPLGLIPLPSKWIIEFGAPVETAALGPQSADDPMVVFDLTDRVRETIQQTLYSLLLQRRSVFF